MSTHYHGTETEVRALNAFIKLARAADSVASRINAHLSGEGLSVSQFGAMEALFHLGPMCQKTLGEKLLKSGGNVTVIVDNLEKRRLVQRTRDSADRRLITVSLTDAGRETISRIIPDHVRRVVSEMSTLTSKQQEQLSALCRAVGTRQAP
jgi:MarR family 2-MHQ and catechol resistance regulon transcriptional repressor